MKASTKKPRNVDEYIATFPANIQQRLKSIRRTIRKAAPDAEEKISYNIPGYKLAGAYLIYFAAFAKHIGMYPAPRRADEFKDELAGYGGGKGTVQFPLDKPLPLDLIRRIVQFRAKLNRETAQAKLKSKAEAKATKKRNSGTKRVTKG
jgi:uncharacterized protein YdhG (YjbR/CyaY superfamily)